MGMGDNPVIHLMASRSMSATLTLFHVPLLDQHLAKSVNETIKTYFFNPQQHSRSCFVLLKSSRCLDSPPRNALDLPAGLDLHLPVLSI
jgi:hypothetical protein